MKVYGQLEKAQLENTTSDTASHPKGMITYRTDLNQAKVSNGTAYKLLIDEDSSQTLSNKTYATPSITGAITAAQTTTPANPSSGSNKLYFKADGKLYTLDSAGNEALVGSGTGGVKNLITNGNADDTSASIFVPYADAASTRPVDGTGGSPTVTASVSSSSPLDGVKSFLLTKPASNVQGQGWSVPFTVDPAYRAKSLKISVDYIVNSGTFVAGSNSTESDVIWYIYDVTNSQLIEPSNIKMFSNNTSISDKFEATFQSSATGSSYRLIAHVQSTSASAYELKVDNITVSPQSYVFGTPVSDSKTITPTTTNLGFTAGVNVLEYWRVGDKLYGRGFISYSSGAGSGSNFIVTLPEGLVIDTTKLGSTINSLNHAGQWSWYDDAGSSTTLDDNFGPIAYESTTAIGFRIPNTSNRFVTSVMTTNDTFSYSFSVPIVGWSSSTQMSDSADTRVIAAKAVANPSNTLSASPTVMNCGTKVFDTHGAYNSTSGVFTVPVEGYYRCSAFTEIAGTEALDQVIVINLYKNGSTIGVSGATRLTTAGVSSTYAQATGMVYAKAGDTLDFRASTSITSPAYSAANIGTSIEFERISGPSAIAASESIIARFTSASGQSIPNASTTIVDFSTKTKDTHNAVTTGGAWKFTAPANGDYYISASVQLQAAAGGGSFYAYVYKNGVLFSQKWIQTTGSSAPWSSYIEDLVPLLAGGYIDIRVLQNSGASRNLAVDNTANFVSVKRVGN